MKTWMNRLAFVSIWVAVTAGVAFLVARNATATDDQTDLTAPVPPIAEQDRATVTLTEHSITPVVSSDGVVTREEESGRWLLVAPAQPADLAYRLLDPPVGVRALIHGGPAGFECAWAGLAPAAGGEVMPSSTGLGPESAGGVSMRCEIPADVRVVAGMTGTMVLAMAEPTAALALPITAVLGTARQGQVIVVNPDGSHSVRDVQLGVADTFWIQITGGLEPGERVLEVPTQYDFGAVSR